MGKRISRRRFLKGSAAAGAGAVAAPYVVPSTAIASKERPGPNDRIGVGYIGVGRRGRQLMNLPEEGQIVAAADVYLPRAEEIAAKYKGKAFQDYRKLLECKEVDAVVVATPDHWHVLPAIHACQAGKDVYIEKPMTLTIREGRLLVQAARKYQRIVQTGSQQRSLAANRTGCELVRNGRIGTIRRVVAHNYPSPWECGLPGQAVPQGLDWDMWCGPTEIVPYHHDIFTPRANPGWISFRPWSGGEVTGWGAHGLDQVQWALGMDQSGPVEVWTEGGRLKAPVYTKPESRARGDRLCARPKVFLRYANGVTMVLDNGPAGGAIFEGTEGTITINRNYLKVEPEELGKEPIAESGVHLYRSNNHMQNWFDCMRSRQLPVADVEIGHRSATVCHLVNIARWLGRRLRWDPATERFPADEEANRYLDRPRRAGYEMPETI